MLAQFLLRDGNFIKIPKRIRDPIGFKERTDLQILQSFIKVTVQNKLLIKINQLELIFREVLVHQLMDRPQVDQITVSIKLVTKQYNLVLEHLP